MKWLISLLVIFLIACSTQPVEVKDVSASSIDWRDVEFKDVLTDQTFKINDLDKPILIETFAVWCPTCRKQQEEIQKLHLDVGDSVTSVSLDVDPSEDEAKVIKHANTYGFDWLWSVSPGEATKSLIDEFGIQVANAPSAPIILVCETKTKLLDFGVKSVEELKQEVEAC
jgi:thiol-disulfide isomerase/thioredoxin